MELQLDPKMRRQLGYKIVDRIDDYFSSLTDRAVQLPLEQRNPAYVRGPLPETGESAECVLEEICNNLMEQGFHAPSANYFGLMNPTPTYMAVLAEMLVAAFNPQLASIARSCFASQIENETIHWVGERIGWDCAFNGTFTSGGSEANLTAIALAMASRFPNIVEEGLLSLRSQPVVYVSTEAHHSLDKAAGLLGLGRKAIRRVPVDDHLEMNIEKLEAAINHDLRDGRIPVCVVATAGTTSSGAIDNLQAAAKICRRHGLWLHVDGAYGAATIFSDRHRNVVEGIQFGDSVTIDPHKWLAMPYAAGVFLTSHPELLEQVFGVASAYMPKSGVSLTDNFKLGAQWSRRMNSLKFWLTLRVHGRQAYEQLINRQMELAKGFGEWVKKSEDYELAAPLRLPILNLRVKGKTAAETSLLNSKIVDEIVRDGQHWISLTNIHNQKVIRLMVISYLTAERHVQELQTALDKAVKKITAQVSAVSI